MSRIGVLRCLTAALLFGASAPVASRLAVRMPALHLAGLLYVGAALAVSPLAARRPPRSIDMKASWKALTAAVVFGGALGPVLLVAGLAQVPAATASLLLNLELVATIVLAATLFHEHLGPRLIFSVVLVTIAGTLLVLDPGQGFSFGALLIVGACVCWGVDNAVTARIDHLSPQHITFVKGVVAGSVNLTLGLALTRRWDLSATDLVTALAIGALGYGVSITLWVKGARDLGAARAQVIFATAPFIGAVISWVVLGDPVTRLQLISVPVAAIGVGISFRTSHQHDHGHSISGQAHEHEHTHDDDHHVHDHDGEVANRHTHRHEHPKLVHSHPHVPDLHHDHGH